MVRELVGRVWVLPDGIETGQILPRATLQDVGAEEARARLLCDVCPGLAEKLAPGDFLWAGENFGQGSAREDAARLLQTVGVRLVLAASFGRIFYRNAINIGLPVAVGGRGETKDGDELAVDLASGDVRNRTRDLKLHVTPVPPTIRPILAAGGLIPYLQKYGSLSGKENGRP